MADEFEGDLAHRVTNKWREEQPKRNYAGCALSSHLLGGAEDADGDDCVSYLVVIGSAVPGTALPLSRVSISELEHV